MTVTQSSVERRDDESPIESSHRVMIREPRSSLISLKSRSRRISRMERTQKRFIQAQPADSRLAE